MKWWYSLVDDGASARRGFWAPETDGSKTTSVAALIGLDLGIPFTILLLGSWCRRSKRLSTGSTGSGDTATKDWGVDEGDDGEPRASLPSVGERSLPSDVGGELGAAAAAGLGPRSRELGWLKVCWATGPRCC